MSKKKKTNESTVERLNTLMTNNQKLVVGGLVILIVAFGVGIFVVGKNATNNFTRLPGEDGDIVASPSPTQIPYPTIAPVVRQTIAVQDVRFNPPSLTLQKGGEINFMNLSGDTVKVVSTDHPDIVIGEIEVGDVSDNIVLSEPGTYTFTNELNTSISLTLTVSN